MSSPEKPTDLEIASEYLGDLFFYTVGHVRMFLVGFIDQPDTTFFYRMDGHAMSVFRLRHSVPLKELLITTKWWV